MSTFDESVDLESEIKRLVVPLATDRDIMSPRRRDVGNSTDMSKVQHVLQSGVIAAHEDTCKALDKTIDECRALLKRAEVAVEEYKDVLQKEGQRIAAQLGATVQELTHTVEWIEQRNATFSRRPAGSNGAGTP